MLLGMLACLLELTCMCLLRTYAVVLTHYVAQCHFCDVALDIPGRSHNILCHTYYAVPKLVLPSGAKQKSVSVYSKVLAVVTVCGAQGGLASKGGCHVELYASMAMIFWQAFAKSSAATTTATHCVMPLQGTWQL